MNAWRGYFEGPDPVTIEEALKESSAYIPMGRFGKPEEIAQAVLFLASDDSSFVTGHLLLVDGGNTAQQVVYGTLLQHRAHYLSPILI